MDKVRELSGLFALLKYKDREANRFHGVGILAQDFIESFYAVHTHLHAAF
jgi:hypothetical protein